MVYKLKSLDLEISNPCNERCVHCYRTCESTKRGFLSLEDVQKIFKELDPIREERINVLLTGGEALLNKDWKKIFVYAIEHNARVSLFTNGTLITDDDVHFLSDFNGCKQFKEVQISLYSLQPEIHDEITGLNGSCFKSLNAIKKLKNAGVEIFVSCPVMKLNQRFVPDLMRYMDKNNIGCCADLFIFPNSDYKSGNIGQRLSLNDLEQFYQETAKNNFELAYIWRNRCPKEIVLEKIFYGAAGTGVLIAGDGNIYPMIGWYEKLGNIHDDSLQKVFLSHPLLEKCRHVKVKDFEECVNCNAVEYCSFCPTPHLTANNGQMMKLNQDYCNYIHQIKKMAERRDAEIAALQR